MKLTCLFLLVWFNMSAQIPKEVNTIIIKGVGFNQVCNALLDSGYAIQKKDNELFTVRTEKKEFPRYWSASYVVDIRIKDSIAYITATIFSSIVNNEKAFYHTNSRGRVYPKKHVRLSFPANQSEG